MDLIYVPHKLLQDLRKLHGLPPFKIDNPLKNDFDHALSIQRNFDSQQVEKGYKKLGIQINKPLRNKNAYK